MKISLITPTYNSEKTLKDTIESIIEQNYPDLEYIIIDGASTDKTKELILSYSDKLDITLVSEADSGIYDAMNKGVARATGDIVGILNADDMYENKIVLSHIQSVFVSHPNIDAVYGDLVYVNQHDTSKQTRFWKAGEYREENLNDGWIIPHPTFFVRREVYAKLEKVFDTRLTIAGDYELILRLLKIHKIKVFYLPEVLVKMREGGTSAHSLSQRIRGWKELRLAWKYNSLLVPKFFILRRVTKKLTQFIKR